MQLSCLSSAARQVASVILAGALCVSTWAQETQQPPSAPQPQSNAVAQPFQLKDYANGRSHFPNPIAPYTAREVQPANLSNAARLEQLMRNWKLYLSMDDAVALAL